MAQLTLVQTECDFKPATQVLLGEITLALELAWECTQLQAGNPDVMSAWDVRNAVNELGGDVLFVKGAASEVFDIPIGASYMSQRLP